MSEHAGAVRRLDFKPAPVMDGAMADKTGCAVLQRVQALFLPLLSLRLPRRARL